MPGIKVNKIIISAFYIATLFSFLFFQLLEPIIISTTAWLIGLVQLVFNVRFVGEGPLWLALVIVCFVLVNVIRKLITEPLGFFVNEDGATGSETAILAFLVAGFFIYILNQVFVTIPMPREWFPEWLIRSFDGWREASGARLAPNTRAVWAIVPWIWHIGPIGYLYYVFLKSAYVKKSAGKESSK